MEINSEATRIRAYKRQSETTNVIAYVVNIHDPVNYDLDLIMDDNIKEKYECVSKGTYRYRENWESMENEGITYRCRLKGIGVRQTNGSKRSEDLRNSHVSIVRMLDQIGGWVIVTLSDIDVYNRVLIEITDPSPGVKELLLGRYPHIFYPYDCEGG